MEPPDLSAAHMPVRARARTLLVGGSLIIVNAGVPDATVVPATGVILRPLLRNPS